MSSGVKKDVPDILKNILARKLEEIAERSATTSIDTLKEPVSYTHLTLPTILLV